MWIIDKKYFNGMISNNGIGHTWPCIDKYKIKRLTMQEIKILCGREEWWLFKPRELIFNYSSILPLFLNSPYQARKVNVFVCSGIDFVSFSFKNSTNINKANLPSLLTLLTMVVPYTSGKIWSARLIFLFFWQCVWIYPL